MEEKSIKETLGFIPEIKKAVEELRTFLFNKEQKPAETPAETPAVETPTETPAEPAKVEFNAEAAITEFKTAYETKLKEIEDKFSSFEASFKATSEALTKSEDNLKKVFELVEGIANKVNELPTAMSSQKKKEGVKVDTSTDLSKESIDAWRKKYGI